MLTAYLVKGVVEAWLGVAVVQVSRPQGEGRGLDGYVLFHEEWKRGRNATPWRWVSSRGVAQALPSREPHYEALIYV